MRRRKAIETVRIGTLAFLVMIAAGSALAGAAPAVMPRLFQWRPFLAPFHSVMLHFPIGFLTMAGILEVYYAFRPNGEVRRVTVLVLWLGLLTGVISATFGLMRAGGGGYDVQAMELHRIYGIAVPLVTAATLVLQWIAYRDAAGRGWMHVYRCVLLGTLALVVVAGHYGGNLTHGSKYLVENAPEFVRELLENDAASSSVTNSAPINERQRYYVEKVQPLLEAKCYKCHGPDKQKGGYRLDKPELALKAGESDHVAIKPGDPMGSNLARLILLPAEHDDVMPPAGKQGLTLEEIMTLLDWIRNGAVFASNETNRNAAAGH